MMNIEENKAKTKDLAIWSTVVLLSGIALVLYYSMHFSAPIQAMLFLFWLSAALGLAYFTSLGQQVFAFAKESKIELEKVVWPTRQETIQTTMIVMVMVAIAGLVLWTLDNLIIWAIGKLTSLG